jgi:electron transfer flavoprotein beta subunit
MKVIVCLKEVTDPALSLDFGLRYPVVFGEGRPLRLDPNDAAALAMALELRTPGGPPVEIELLSIGPERVERYLRDGLALGANRAARIQADPGDELSPYRKALLLAGAVSLTGVDLVLAGARSLDTGNGQVGPLLATRLGLPCVGCAVNIEIDEEQKALKATRDIGRGEREAVECSLPAVVTVKGDGRLPYASLEGMLESRTREIEVLSPVDLCVSPAQMKEDPAHIAGLLMPRPRTKKVATPSSSLPAFYRILKLLEGGITKRRGLMLEGGPEEMAERLFEILKEEEVITPAAGR